MKNVSLNSQIRLQAPANIFDNSGQWPKFIFYKKFQLSSTQDSEDTSTQDDRHSDDDTQSDNDTISDLEAHSSTSPAAINISNNDLIPDDDISYEN